MQGLPTWPLISVIFLTVLTGGETIRAENPRLKAEVHFQRGNVFLRTDQFPKAIAAYTLAIQAYPQFATAYHKRGTAHYFSDNHPAACLDWKRACDLGHECMAWNFGIYEEICKKDSQ